MHRKPRHRRSLRSRGSPAPDQRFLTTDQVIETTGLTREFLWRARQQPQGLASGIHYVRVGRRLFWHLANLQRWLASHELDAPSSAPANAD